MVQDEVLWVKKVQGGTIVMSLYICFGSAGVKWNSYLLGGELNTINIHVLNLQSNCVNFRKCRSLVTHLCTKIVRTIAYCLK